MRVTMVGRLSDCYLLAFRVAPEEAARVLPEGLSPVVHDGAAHWNVVLSKVDRMRPRGAPRALGMSYVHISYRIYVKAHTSEGEVEGLFFARSDVDRTLMSIGGNVATDFRFHTSDVAWSSSERDLRVEVRDKRTGEGDASVLLDLASRDAPTLPPYLKYAPLGLSVKGRTLRIADVERDERAWSERPVVVREARFEALRRLWQEGATLVGATQVAPLDYTWRLGRKARLSDAAP